MKGITISIIVAVSRQGVIGNNNDIPWHISGDMKRFKELTMGKPMIMGRKTFESLGRVLPGRDHVVITRNPDYKISDDERVHILPSFDLALEKANSLAIELSVDEVMVVGGAAVYALALHVTDRLYWTEIDADFDGDVHFPPFECSGWREVSREHGIPRDDTEPPHDYVVFEKQRV